MRIWLVAALMLSGCMSWGQDAYDSQASRECDRESNPHAQSVCRERVDQNHRAHAPY